MNANFIHYSHALPLTWDWQADAQDNTDKRIGGWEIKQRAVDVLNESIEKMGIKTAALRSDQVAACGREILTTHPDSNRLANCIIERCKTIALVAYMLKERYWQSNSEVLDKAEVLLGYSKHHHDAFIPHDAPVIGHLDDAILMDSSKYLMQEELENYMDFRRLRLIEARLQGKQWNVFRYARSDWQESREAEKELLQHLNTCRQTSYTVESSKPMFHVF